MTFLSQIERVGADLERRLGMLLEAGDGTAGDGAGLADAMRYAALGGGKRLRPFLLIQAAALFNVPERAALDAACALECVHCYSLVHDDLPAMDDDAVRRGRPSVHVAFDEATAILAGDCLLTLAFEVISASETHQDPAVRAGLVHLLAKASGRNGLALGQALDLTAEHRPFSKAETIAMQSLKTGALFRFACEAGAVLGGADAASRKALVNYGHAFGRAFQLADDLLDAQGDADTMGKAAAKDAERGKATLVALLGIDAAKTQLASLVAEAEAALVPFGGRASMLTEAARFVAQRRA